MIINAVILGIAWGAMWRNVSNARRDIHDIKEALVFEPVNGKIEVTFIPRLECQLREESVGKRLDGCEERLRDHQRRITAVETRARL